MTGSPNPLPGPTELAEQLALTRLLTLTGPGGGGKTRLAARVAEAAGLPVHRVDLSPCRDPALVPSAVAAALHTDTAPEAGSDAVRTVLARLSRGRGLLLLDTCEHVLTGCAYLAGRLHDSCPGLQILTTGRRPLDVPGEHVVAVPPLSPEQTEALLAEQTAAHGAEPPGPWSGRLAELLDGDPLSVLLAARALLTRPPERLYDELRTFYGRFTALVDGPEHPARHRSLLRTVEWSYDLCNRRERLLWAKLSAFSGPFTAEQVHTVFPDARELGSLVRSSVVLTQDLGVFRLPLAHREFGLRQLCGYGDPAGPADCAGPFPQA